MATGNQTRRSYARVKVEVDLLREFPKRIKIRVKKSSRELMEKWIKIKYDYVPKYCKTCMIQGHDMEQCYVVHPELYPKKKKKEMQAETKEVDRTEKKEPNKSNSKKMKHEQKRREYARESYAQPQAIMSKGIKEMNKPVEIIAGLHLKEAPNLIDETEDEIQRRKDREEEETIDFNIQQISKVGDLSPRFTNSLKAKRWRTIIPLQVKTRSSKKHLTISYQ
ncbi:hypothetical protein H5410_043452 [Solanum commersonii]|uniref:Uncharacterized protein n=1 Tax=Solanum commersonii TaxID=4109 RepID=A0A9J5XYX3_SOLCO|nr:hypothetical protein H5410_043452 [Solanum commersonii]